MSNFCRTNLVPVSGIRSIYPDPDRPDQKLDVSELINIRFLATDAFEALKALDFQVTLNKGNLLISDLFRPWDVQAKAYDDWVHGRRSSYAAPPGHSWHMAGRAIDIDVIGLRFESKPKQEWLRAFWDIAIPMGWRAIISEPNMGVSECWHFQFLGKDWSYLASKTSDGELAMAAILDAGKWEQNEPKLQNLFLQAQLNRLQRLTNAPWLVLDGDVGPKTVAAMKIALNASCTVETAIQKLVKM